MDQTVIRSRLNELCDSQSWEQALDLAKEQFQLHPTEKFWICWKGNLLRTTGRWQEAFNFWNQCQLIPDYGQLLQDLGNSILSDIAYGGGKSIQQSLGIEHAIAMLSSGCRLKPNAASTQNLSIAYELIGKPCSSAACDLLAVLINKQPPDLDQSQLLEDENFFKGIRDELGNNHESICDLAWSYYTRIENQLNFNNAKAAFQLAVKIQAATTQASRTALEICMQLIELECLPKVYSSQAQEQSARIKVDIAAQKFSKLSKLAPRLSAQDTNILRRCSFMYSGFCRAYLMDNPRQHYEHVSAGLQSILFQGENQLWQPQHQSTKQRKIRLGVACQYLINNGPSGWLFEFLSRLPENNYEFFTYRLLLDSTSENKNSSRYQQLGQHKELLFNQHHYLNSIQTMRNDQLDVLLIPHIGMTIGNRIISLTRIAPYQATLWAHPVTTGSNCIDAFYTSEAMESKESENQFTEELIRLPKLGMYFQSPIELTSEEQIEFEPKKYIISDYLQFKRLACMQSVYKLSPQFDDIYSSILASNPTTVLLLRSSGYPEHDALLGKRLSKSEKVCSNRIIFLPKLGKTEFRHAFAHVSFCLDSPGWSGGLTSLDAFSMNCPVITLKGNSTRSNHTTAMLEIMGLNKYITHNQFEYRQLANYLCNDDEELTQARESIRRNKHLLFEDLSCISSFDQHIKQRVHNSHMQCI